MHKILFFDGLPLIPILPSKLFVLSKKSNGNNINIFLFCQIPMFCGSFVRGNMKKIAKLRRMPYHILYKNS
ncbi:MAG: hypothetical protein D3917_04080 [Candidatus Electrothrix sp. AX5]|nr:hypothetical protein [Candidatus Electrothrix sp. AX5]